MKVNIIESKWLSGPHYRLYMDSFSDLHTPSTLCTHFALFSCTLVNCKLVFPTLFIHYHISYYYSYITTHHPLSHHPPHHLLSHHLLYNPHTPTLYYFQLQNILIFHRLQHSLENTVTLLHLLRLKSNLNLIGWNFKSNLSSNFHL